MELKKVVPTGLKFRSGRGSVGRSLRRKERMLSDPEFREKEYQHSKLSQLKKGKKYLKRKRELIKLRNLKANKRCEICNKALTYTSWTNRCQKHPLRNWKGNEPK